MTDSTIISKNWNLVGELRAAEKISQFSFLGG